MEIRFFFEFNNQVVQLPVNPKELVINSPGNNKTEEIVKLGEINIITQKALKEITIECFLPANSNFPHVLTKGRFKSPQFYIDFFEKIRKQKKPFRFIISDTKINLLMAIENFEYGYRAGDDDIHYNLSLKEYIPYASKKVEIKLPTARVEGIKSPQPAKMVAPPPQERPKTGFAIGDTVIANGNYWYSSYGANPHGTFNAFTGKISHIVADTTRRYRYHITTPSGGYRGWVAENQIRHP